MTEQVVAYISPHGCCFCCFSTAMNNANFECSGRKIFNRRCLKFLGFYGYTLCSFNPRRWDTFSPGNEYMAKS